MMQGGHMPTNLPSSKKYNDINKPFANKKPSNDMADEQPQQMPANKKAGAHTDPKSDPKANEAEMMG